MEVQKDGRYDKCMGTNLWLEKLNVSFDLRNLHIEGVTIRLDHSDEWVAYEIVEWIRVF